jgi:hypothetical protein
MIVLKPTDAEALFAPYAQRIARVVHDAWEDWKANPLARTIEHPRVRAICVWNQCVARARREFTDTDVRVENMREWAGLLFDERVFVRFKKGSSHLLSRNYPTDTAMAFNDPQQDLLGSGIARLDLIYVLDESQVDIERIAIVQRHRSRVAWAIPLHGGTDERQNVIPFAPTPPVGPSTPAVADRILKSKRRKPDVIDPRKRGADT